MCVYYGDINLINTNNWGSNQKVLKNMVAVYAITDTIPLLIDREKMMFSTIIHHVCVFLSYIYIVFSDLQQEGIFKSIIVLQTLIMMIRK